MVYRSHSACTRCEQPPMAAITPGRKSRKVASSPGTVKCTCLPNHLESQPHGTGDHITKLGPYTWRPPGECGILSVLGRVYSCRVLACEGPRRGLEAEPRVKDDGRTSHAGGSCHCANTKIINQTLPDPVPVLQCTELDTRTGEWV